MSDDVLRSAKRLAADGRIVFTRHAEQRMLQRRISRRDVMAGISTATGTRPGDNGATRLEGGTDATGDEITIVVTIEDDVIIITVF